MPSPTSPGTDPEGGAYALWAALGWLLFLAASGIVLLLSFAGMMTGFTDNRDTSALTTAATLIATLAPWGPLSVAFFAMAAVREPWGFVLVPCVALASSVWLSAIGWLLGWAST